MRESDAKGAKVAAINATSTGDNLGPGKSGSGLRRPLSESPASIDNTRSMRAVSAAPSR